MSDSLQEQIIKKIAEALAQIPNIKSVQRHQASGMDLGTMPTILVREGDCAAELTKSSHERIRRLLEVLIVVATGIDEESDSRSGGEVLNGFIAEIEQIIGADETWGKLALMTSVPEYIRLDVDAETPHLSRGVRIEVTYEHARGNPWT